MHIIVKLVGRKAASNNTNFRSTNQQILKAFELILLIG